MAGKKYVSPENLEATESQLKAWIVDKIKTAIDQLVDGAPEALDTLKEISEYISEHTTEYEALLAIVSDKASQTDLTALQTAVANLQTQIIGVTHSHSNKDILDATTASFTTELLTKLNSLVNYDDTELAARVQATEETAHSHSNKLILDGTTASYTSEEQTKLAGIDEGANKTTVDTALSSTSTNPVQNKVINAKITSLEELAEAAQEDIDTLAASITPMTDLEVTEMFNRVFNAEE